MKYKKEFRWLLFLLIPFIIMLIVLIVVPLQIVAHSHPIVAEAYNQGKINLMEKQVRASTGINGNIIENILNKYAQFLNIFNSFNIIKNSSFSNNKSLSINSAYQFINQNKNQSNQFYKSSMWFATNVTLEDNLPLQLKSLYNEYLKKQLFLRAFIEPDSTLAAISVLFLTANSSQSISFQYPTNYEPDFSSLSASPQGSFYPTILREFTELNTSSGSVAVIKDQPEQNKVFLVICKVSKSNDLTYIPCVHLDISKLAKQLQQQTQFSSNVLFEKAYLILNVLPTTSISFSRSAIIQFTNTTITTNPKLTERNQGYSTFDFSIRQQISHQNIVINIQNNFERFLSPISISSNAEKTISMNFLTQNNLAPSFESIDLRQNLVLLFLPIVILIIVGNIVIFIILKSLLQGVDQQVGILQNSTKFIVDGDINIDIPNYFGTEDIKQVYDKIRIINKLHRYSTNTYFTGHFAEKVLKYNEALQFISGLGYDAGCIYQNMGECYTYIELWDEAIEALKKSVSLALSQLKSRFNLTMEDVHRMKIQNKTLPQGYKQFQIILIRRMFKLNFVHLKYFQLRTTFTKADTAETNAQKEEFQKKMDRQMKQSTQNFRMLKIAFYPDFSNYSECLVALLNEAKQMANLKYFQDAKRLIQGAKRLCSIYIEQFEETTKKLKVKGSKYRLFHQKNKLTYHSRINPQVLKIARNLFEAKVISVTSSSIDRFNELATLYTQAMKTGYISLAIGYTVASELRKLMIQLKIDTNRFQSTQIFKQALPFLTLHYGPITKEVEPQLLKIPIKTSLGLQREFVFVIDCARNIQKNDQCSKYSQEKAEYVFDKLIKKTDRLSIIKFNVKNSIKIQCNLLMKETNESILKHEIHSSFEPVKPVRGNLEEMLNALYITVNRIKDLQSDKAIVMFFKSISHYKHLFERRRKKTTQASLNRSLEQQVECCSVTDFGDYAIQVLNADQLRNCKLILYCGKGDSVEQFRAFFGLQSINRRLWGRCNTKNILVYIIGEKHKTDVDRILMLKTQDVPDNHVFIL